jgi:hypothetical protein
MATYWIPPRCEPAASGGTSVERWLFGLAASYERWPRDRYTFQVPGVGLPLYMSHTERRIVSAGVIDGDVGVARRFAEVDGLGLVVLLEVGPDYMSVLRDVAEERCNGLSIGYCLDEPPGGGPEWLYTREISLTASPADPRARVISRGQGALHDWEVLTGEIVPVPDGAAAR